MIPDFGFYNMDCMEGMKQFPDKYFELAIVDPPYGDGGASGQVLNDSENDSTDTAIPKINRGGWHGKHKYNMGTLPEKELQETRRNMGFCELAEHGRRSMQKNHRVGHSPEAGIF